MFCVSACKKQVVVSEGEEYHDEDGERSKKSEKEREKERET
jgi:hypothetical protein